MTGPRTTWGLVRYFLYLGSLGFGGPAVLGPGAASHHRGRSDRIAVFWLRGTV